MTELADILRARIAATGPMTVAEYMAECLLHPLHGYYTTRPPFGAEGDFTTAPEISQMFGELLGLCLAQHWLDTGAPARFTLAELGPGRGTLMADVLRATRGVPGFHAAMEVVLVEASPRLRALQAQALAPYASRWTDDAGLLPEQPLFLLANEFFDALPIRQYQRDAAGWCERLVGLHDGALAFGLSAPQARPDLTAAFPDDPPGTVVETCPQAAAQMDQVARRLRQHGGLALIIDYGGWRSKGDTLQALKDHAFTDPLAEPGHADLTAHVDFAALAARAEGLACRYTTQGRLLTALGIDARSARLAERLTGAALENHLAATRRLTAGAEMGELFKALAVYAEGAPVPPGFA
ncbi:MAG: SAM-dependent methyltransferase [Rhodobacteraceae bacterium]|nr:SAM-dependent methyltransferase [Paracoccaceae bacterium]